MNREAALMVANAVLYEGYMLYPYRPSALKNRQRWSFGILYPPDYEEVGKGTERSQMHSECLIKTHLVKTDLVKTHPFANTGRKDGAPSDVKLSDGTPSDKTASDGAPVLRILLRFLHLIAREVSEKTTQGLEPVASLIVDGKPIESGDEGVERSVQIEVPMLEADFVPPSPKDGENGAPAPHEWSFSFSFPASRETEPLGDLAGQIVGEIGRRQEGITGTIAVSAVRLREDLLKLTIDVSNSSSMPAGARDRDSALLRSLLSAHTILTFMNGEFVSLLDPPDELRAATADCKNAGNFPVLIGNEGDRDTLLCSPIVLYDYPQIAPESAGDFYDATEMDEMLTLRVMTLTDGEKDAMRRTDDRVRSLLQRTEQSAREQLMRTHGTIRSMRPVSEKS